jgi:hypothetical protein
MHEAANVFQVAPGDEETDLPAKQQMRTIWLAFYLTLTLILPQKHHQWFLFSKSSNMPFIIRLLGVSVQTLFNSNQMKKGGVNGYRS